MSSLAVRQAFHSSETGLVVPDDDCPEGALRLLDLSSEYETGGSLSLTEFTPEWVRESSSGVLRDQVAELVRRAAILEDGTRIVRQMLCAESAVIRRLDYSFCGKSYACWVVGRSEHIYAPRSPITEFLATELNAAFQCWREGRRFSAAQSMAVVEDMARADRNCDDLLERHKRTIPSPLLSLARMERKTRWFGGAFTAFWLLAFGIIGLILIVLIVLMNR